MQIRSIERRTIQEVVVRKKFARVSAATKRSLSVAAHVLENNLEDKLPLARLLRVDQ